MAVARQPNPNVYKRFAAAVQERWVRRARSLVGPRPGREYMLRSSLAALAVVCVMIGLGHAVSISQAQTSQAQTKTAKPEDAKIHAGRESFYRNCLQCHATYEGQYSAGPNLSGELKMPHPKKTPAEVRSILKNGKGRMPSFADKLTPAQTDDLIAFLHTL